MGSIPISLSLALNSAMLSFIYACIFISLLLFINKVEYRSADTFPML